MNQLYTEIIVPAKNGKMKVAPHDIVRCEALSNYTKLVLQDKRQLVIAKTLGAFMANLDAATFVRVHQSHVVNAAFVDRCSDAFINLKDGSKVSVSRRMRKLAMNFFLQSTTAA